MSKKYWRRKDLQRLQHNRTIILALYDELAEQKERNRMLILCYEAEKVGLNDEIKTLKASR